MSRFVPIRPALLTVLALAPLAVASRANDAVPIAAAGGVAREPRVLVLPGGRTLTGDIRLTQNGYQAALGPNTGYMFIAEEMVWFTADSLPAAYEELFKRFPDRSADGYVQLANWCLEQSLYDQAQENLKAALRLEPDHATARLVAKELGKLLSQHPNLSHADEPVASPAENGHPALSEVPPRIAMTEQEITREFVSRIQPILVNGCGNASCHGRSSDGSFRLKNVRPGHPSFRSFTEFNHETIKRFINIDEPASSPILVAPRDARHAALREPLFAGPAGAGQWRALTAWVNAVAQANGSEPAPMVAETGGPRPAIQLTSASSTEAVDEPAASAADEGAIDTILRQSMKSGEPDAFDPSEFNRRFAPQADDLSTSPISNGPTR